MVNSEQFIMAVDIGTSETKAVLVNKEGYFDSASKKNSLIYPKHGWVEQDPNLIANSIYESIKILINKHPQLKDNIEGLTFTSQMQGILPLDKSGKSLTNLITWLDTRAAELTEKIMFKGKIKISGVPVGLLLKYLKITGGVPGTDGKNTVAKSIWIKENLPKIYEETYKFVDTKDYAVYLASNKWVTSIDMAFISWLMDSRNKPWKWSEELLEINGLDINKYLDIRPSTDIIGEISEDFSRKSGLNQNIPIINGAGDLLTSAIGSGAIEFGELHANVGTAGWIGTHHPVKTKDIPHYAGTIASGIPDIYLLLCKQETLGGALEWAKETLYPEQYLQSKSNSELYKEIDELVEKTDPASDRLIFTPWMHGERSPINDPHLRAQWFNISMNCSRGDLFRSIFEGIAFNLKWGIEIVERLTNNTKNQIRIIGGASNSDIWSQIFADIWQKKVLRVQHPQMASAIGAAGIAMVTLGIIKDFNEMNNIAKIEKIFIPNVKNGQKYSKNYEIYRKLYKKNKKLFHILNK